MSAGEGTGGVLRRYTPPDAHVKYHLKGNRRLKVLFHGIMGHLDVDWPGALGEDSRCPGEDLTCPVCGGQVYRMAGYTPQEMRLLAKQLSTTDEVKGNLKLKINMWKLGCPGVLNQDEGRSDG
jgi:hypothetical protein